MKKLLFAVATAAFLFSFSSCGKEDPAQGVNVDEIFTSMATIKGYAYVNVNTSGSNVQQAVPAGTKLVFTVANADYGIQGGVGNYVKVSEVGENGAFEVTLPAREDGSPVTAQITGDPVVIDIDMDGVKKSQVFKIAGGESESIVKGLTYQKKLTYNAGDNLTESANWAEGTYTVTLKYNNGKEEEVVPEGTEVKITIDKDDFVPARTNDLIFNQTVGEHGVLQIQLPAKSLLDGGLAFEMESAFIANYITVTAGNESTSKYIFQLNDNGTVYGGEVNNAPEITFSRGTQVEETNVLSTWKNATYKVRYLYDRDNFDNLNAYSSIPNDDAKITVIERRSAVDSKLSDYTRTMTYAQFYNNGDGYIALAPDPALSNDALPIVIKIDFLVDKKTGENSTGGTIMNKFKYSYTDTNSLRGDITTNGGADVNQPDGSDPAKNAILIESGATQLTFNN